MNRIENQRKPAAAVRADSPAPVDTPPESLDKVRDILFGGQMRAVENRLQGLEERLLREQETLRADFSKQVANVESNAKRELQALGEKLVAERTKRVEELKSLSTELKEALRNLERRHVKLEQAANTADAELRDHLLEQSRATAVEIERLSQRVSAELSREVQSLRHDKLDVASLASLFADMSGRLAGDSRPSGKNGPRS